MKERRGNVNAVYNISCSAYMYLSINVQYALKNSCITPALENAMCNPRIMAVLQHKILTSHENVACLAKSTAISYSSASSLNPEGSHQSVVHVLSEGSVQFLQIVAFVLCLPYVIRIFSQNSSNILAFLSVH